MIKNFIFLVFAGILFTTCVWAEHEVDHRYNIRGYVLDENQQAISDLTVQALDGPSILGTSKTDSNGYYSLHLHLHDTDNRRILRLRAGPHESDLRVTLDPGDTSTLRVHDANFVAGEYIEGGLRRFRLPPWVYPVGGFLVLGIIVVWLEKRRKKKLKLKHAEANEQHSPGHQKAKKRRKKKH
jgi:hypothetical protein